MAVSRLDVAGTVEVHPDVPAACLREGARAQLVVDFANERSLDGRLGAVR